MRVQTLLTCRPTFDLDVLFDRAILNRVTFAP